MIVESYEDVILLSGALRSNFWDTIHTAISLTLRKFPNGVIVDCSGITECTAEGGETFHDALDYIRNHGARFIVASVPPPVLEILKTVPEVRSQLPIAASVEEARRSMVLSPEERVKATTSNVAASLLHLYGTECDNAALDFFCDEVRSHGEEAHLVFVIEVPRDLPIQAPLPQQEELAHRTLENAKNRLRDRHLVSTTHVERARDLAAGIAAVAEKNNVGTVYVPLPCHSIHIDRALQIAKILLSRLRCPVVLVRGIRLD